MESRGSLGELPFSIVQLDPMGERPEGSTRPNPGQPLRSASNRMTLDDDDEDDDTSAIDDGRGGNIGSSAPRIDDDDDDGEKDKADDVDTSSAIDDSEDIQSARFNPHARRVLIPMQIRQGVEQRPTLRPNTEPQEGQAEEEKIDAFTKAMEHFQVGDLQAPQAIKSYWSSEKGPVTRGDFEEYKEWAEAQILKANTLALETASASWHQERELEKERALRIKAERAIETEQEMSPEELKHWARQNRGNIRIPTFRADEDDERREAEKGQFLYDDHSFHVKELTISVLLLRAQVAVKGKDVHRTSQFVFEAQRLALEFNFPPLEAKCLYWKGRAEARLGYTAAAVDTFTQALPCEGIYREGQDVRSRIDRARKAARGDPTTPKSAKTPRGRSKRQSYTGRGEHPPQFDFEGEDEAEDDDPETGAGQEREEIDSAMQTMKISGNNPPHGRRRRPSKVDFKDQGKQGGKGQKVHEKKTPARPSNVSQNF